MGIRAEYTRQTFTCKCGNVYTAVTVKLPLCPECKADHEAELKRQKQKRRTERLRQQRESHA